MKNKIIFLGILLVLFSSCDEWLDVSPKSEIKADELFETEAGFKDALVGVYIGMTSPDVYGRDLSWQAIEFLACQYQTPTGTFAQFQKYNYTDKTSKSLIERIWNKEYNLIAEINFLLESLEKQGDCLSPEIRHIIKGEALGLRAMCHFDLIRLFAKGDLVHNKTALAEKCIPYVTRHSKIITEQRSYQETLELLHKDIDEALQELKADPLYYDEEEGTSYDPDHTNFSDDFYKYRECRMSYPALLLLKSRVYHWEGNATEAVKYAEKLISAFEVYTAFGTKVWATESNDLGNEDRMFKGELLFALHVNKLSEYMGDAYSRSSGGNVNNDRLIQTTDFVNTLFHQASGEANSDLRRLYQYESVTEGLLTVKIKVPVADNTTTRVPMLLVPLMRISEAYLIAAEGLIGTNRSQAVKYLNFLKMKRNIPERFFIPENTTTEDLLQLIIQEYQKEFTQEGQLFFCYKRLGLSTFDGIQYLGEKMTDTQYTLPYPDVEKDLGGR